MAKSRFNPGELAERLDTVIPSGRSHPLSTDSDPSVEAALRLANAPYATLPEAKKSQMLAQVLSAHQARPGTGRWQNLSATQQMLAVVAGVVLVATMAVAAIGLSRSSPSGQNEGDLFRMQSCQ